MFVMWKVLQFYLTSNMQSLAVLLDYSIIVSDVKK